MSVAKENFIKAVYHLEQNAATDAKPGIIAKILGISNAAATDMARKLARMKYIHYEKYKVLKLTEDGQKLALNILRKHRLWETFLHQTFDLNLHEIHREAELLEHQTSDFLADKIDAFLGNPSFDPHGDPIPNPNGELSLNTGEESLSNVERGAHYTVTRLSSSEKEFFDFCTFHNIVVGSHLTVDEIFKKNQMVAITIGAQKLLLNFQMAGTIYVKPVIPDLS